MDDTPLGEIYLEQIPKEFRPNRHEHKSPWAIILITLTIIIFGIFWYFEKKKEVIPTPVVSTRPSPQNSAPLESRDITSDLEASVGSIDIPDYSSSL